MSIDTPAQHEKHVKTYAIVVNGREKTVTEHELSFEQVVRLAFDPVPTGDGVAITVTYRRGHGNKPEGILVAGDTVKVKDGMIFNVSVTDKS